MSVQNNFAVIDVSTPMYKDIYTLVDEDNLPLFINPGPRWGVKESNCGKLYVVSNRNRGDGKGNERKWLHKVIMGADANIEVDHIDRNTLINIKSNLRFATHAQNAANRDCRRNNKYRGVYRSGKGWRAKVNFQGRFYTTHTYVTIEEAALAYNNIARLLHGEFAVLNYLQEDYLCQ